MNFTPNAQLGLLYLAHLRISADGIIDTKEYQALTKIKAKESISYQDFNKFQESVRNKTERDIYREGIEMMNNCTEEEKLTAFVHLYKMSEADGRTHIKEVRLLLYSIKNAGIEFNDVVARAQSITNY